MMCSGAGKPVMGLRQSLQQYALRQRAGVARPLARLTRDHAPGEHRIRAPTRIKDGKGSGDLPGLCVPEG